MTELRFGSAEELAAALRRAAAAHGEHEKTLGHYDEGWPDWYAQYMMGDPDSPRPDPTAGLTPPS
ncbi:hypothetical protein AB0M46_32250 [Dactylosporangium sp. NPDC051485]|uniref:hypothetical protein n=1 Tax=Dactylosporangium sp. NPDC051485 TaxID=3154846 RepID=UPI00341543F9